MKNTRLFWLFFLAATCILGSCASRRSALKHPQYGQKHSAQSPGAGSSASLAYIEQYKDIAIEEMHQYGVPASITLAQGLLESGNGNSYLAREANNHFGIKCGGNWKGKSVSRRDDRAGECFRAYSHPEESFRDHSQFLRKPRYSKLFQLAKDDYKGWAKGLRAAGYATNPRYPQLLIDLIERYQLDQYDRISRAYAKASKPKPTQAASEILEQQPLIPGQQAQGINPSVKNSETEAPNTVVAMRIYEVKAGDTLYSISQQGGVTVEQIKVWNDLSSEELSEGQLLLIAK